MNTFNFSAFAFVILFFGATSFAQQSNSPVECPLGAKETHLTFQRVMRNFGRFTMPADALALRGINPYEKITETQINEAVVKLDYVMACAEAVVAKPEGALLPTSLPPMTAEQMTEFVEELVYFMTDFRDVILDYKNMWIAAAGLPPDQRDYAALLKKSKEMDKLVERAHKRL